MNKDEVLKDLKVYNKKNAKLQTEQWYKADDVNPIIERLCEAIEIIEDDNRQLRKKLIEKPISMPVTVSESAKEKGGPVKNAGLIDIVAKKLCVNCVHFNSGAPGTGYCNFYKKQVAKFGTSEHFEKR